MRKLIFWRSHELCFGIEEPIEPTVARAPLSDMIFAATYNFIDSERTALELVRLRQTCDNTTAKLI